MFEQYFGLRENPFVAGHQPRFIFPSQEHQEALAHLRYGIENREAFLLITGEVGTGKTTAIYNALAEWGRGVVVALITNSSLTRAELLEEICLRFGIPLPPGSSKPQALVQLEAFLAAVRKRGDVAILLLDEAQNLGQELLEEIRLLSNQERDGEKLLQIFLVGQPELETKLASPELRQLRQRIAVHYRLRPLTEEETAGYIHHRISVAGGNSVRIFPNDACREVHRLTRGIPREVNTVSGRAMLNAFVEDSASVLPRHVQAVERESDFQSVIPPDAVEALPAAPRPAPSPPSPPRATESWPAAPTAPPPRPVETPWPPVPTTPPTTAPQSATPRTPPSATPAEPPAAPLRIAPHPQAPFRSAPPAAPIVPAPGVRPEPLPLPPLRAVPAPPALDDTAVLPARLREKLSVAEEEERSSGTTRWMLRIAVVALIVVSIVLWQRFGGSLMKKGSPPASGPTTGARVQEPSSPGGAPSSSTPSPAPATTSTPAGRDSQATEPRATEPERRPLAATHAPEGATASNGAAARPSPTRSTPPSPTRVTSTPATHTPATAVAASDTTAGHAAAPAPPPPSFGVAVGSFLTHERADTERTKLSHGTPLAARILTVQDGGVPMYSLVLGNFPDRTAAETAASDLIASGLVNEARVVSLGRRAPPHR